MRVYSLRNWDKGIIDSLEAESIPDNSASSSLNWLTLGDKIELSGNYTIKGTEQSGVGKVTGLHVATKSNGEKEIFYTHGQKVKYWTGTDWAETNTPNLLGSDADGEDIMFTDFSSLSGDQVFMSSPNSSLYKIMLANPSFPVDQYDSVKNYKGYAKSILNSLFLWGLNNDKTGFYRSKIDNQNYTAVNNEVIGTGDGATKTFNNTLVFKAGGARRTCFGVVVTDTVETFRDDYNGNLIGSAGGTGTINYATGQISVTFKTEVLNLQNVTCDYQWEDSSVNGIADFTYSTPRQASEGDELRQDSGGGKFQNLFSYADNEYCMHEIKTWRVQYSIDDTSVTNRIYREKVGIESMRGAVATGEGIFFIDTSDKKKPLFKKLTFETAGSEVIPVVVTYNLDLSKYDFSDCAGYEWKDYILFSCAEIGESNNRIIAFHKIWNSIDLLEYFTRCFADNGGVLLGGDSLSNNVMELFSGSSANGSIPKNYWIGNLSELQLNELKKYKRLTFKGEIARSQNLKVYLSYDDASFVEIGEIQGTGSYVNSSSNGEVGANEVGEQAVGGGNSGIEKSPYVREFRVRSPKFERVKVKIVATNVGYASVSEIEYYDIKTYGQKNKKQYRTT